MLKNAIQSARFNFNSRKSIADAWRFSEKGGLVCPLFFAEPQLWLFFSLSALLGDAFCDR
jgi:hypothetical protein